MIYGLFCIIFWAKSQINIKQLLKNIAVKLLIDRIESELATGCLELNESLHLLPISSKQGTYCLFNIELAKSRDCD